MLELNISFIFHLLCIAIGCQFLKFFFNKFYDNIINYQNKENNRINNYNLENNILKEKTKKIQEELDVNIKNINSILKEVINKKINIKNIQKFKNNKISLSDDKKKLIDNYFIVLLKKIN